MDNAPSEMQVAQILLGQLVPRLCHVMATLKLADHLSAGTKSAEELAAATGTHAPALGEERTPSQYNTLLDQADFKMTRIVPTASLVSIVEAVPR